MKDEKSSAMVPGIIAVKTMQKDCGFTGWVRTAVQTLVGRDKDDQNWQNNGQTGFTLIELVIVLVALGTLSAFAATRLSGFSEQVDRRAAADSVVTAAQRVLLSQSPNTSEYDTCSEWHNDFGSSIIGFIESDSFDDSTKYGTNFTAEFTENAAIPGVEGGCAVEFNTDGGGGTAGDINRIRITET